MVGTHCRQPIVRVGCKGQFRRRWRLPDPYRKTLYRRYISMCVRFCVDNPKFVSNSAQLRGPPVSNSTQISVRLCVDSFQAAECVGCYVGKDRMCTILRG